MGFYRFSENFGLSWVFSGLYWFSVDFASFDGSWMVFLGFYGFFYRFFDFLGLHWF